ncbi:hypothetical protein EYF80_021676 [Liparis tanakae]|uniref:Uncharacterized protein n=1 Tax=Liparis tanakae TaxID=230148 RepID=A0A4Z2HR30_9TELE|nr:hypothetical protein EYF80_021676 [Liparis tanakae]
MQPINLTARSRMMGNRAPCLLESLAVDGGRADRCEVSIARILSSVSDNHRGGAMDQWEAGEGWRQQKQVNDGNGRRINTVSCSGSHYGVAQRSR